MVSSSRSLYNFKPCFSGFFIASIELFFVFPCDNPMLGMVVLDNGEFIGKATVNGLIVGSPIHPDAGYDALV